MGEQNQPKEAKHFTHLQNCLETNPIFKRHANNQRNKWIVNKKKIGMNWTKYGSQIKLSGSLQSNPSNKMNAWDTLSQTNQIKTLTKLEPKGNLESQIKLQEKQYIISQNKPNKVQITKALNKISKYWNIK